MQRRDCGVHTNLKRTEPWWQAGVVVGKADASISVPPGWELVSTKPELRAKNLHAIDGRE